MTFELVRVYSMPQYNVCLLFDIVYSPICSCTQPSPNEIFVHFSHQFVHCWNSRRAAVTDNESAIDKLHAR